MIDRLYDIEIAGCSFMQHASIFNPEIFIPAHATEKENYIPG